MIHHVRKKLIYLVSAFLLAACGSEDTSVSSSSPQGGSVTLASATTVEDGTTLGTANWADGSTPSGGLGQPVSGLPCAVTGASYAYAHLSIYRNGELLALPRDIGVVAPTLARQTGCVYPAHTRDFSGKIRIDTATNPPVTLGQFFAIWGQSLAAANVAGIANSAIKVYIADNGNLTQYMGDLASIPLLAKREITIMIGATLAQIPTYAWNDPPPLSQNPFSLTDSTTVGTPTWPDGDTVSGGQGQTIDGIICAAGMDENYHVHSHVAIAANGTLLALPRHIGLPIGCNYEIHTHHLSGVVHTEAPAVKRFTLGQLFAIWGQPLSTTNVAGIAGTVKVYIKDGGEVRIYQGNPGDVELTSHREVTLQIGSALAEIPTYHWDEWGQ